MEKLFILAFIVILGSAFFSMIEAALFSVSLSKARVLKEQKRSGSQSLVSIKENIHHPITVVVIFTNIFNIVGSMLVGLAIIDVLGNAWLGIASAIFTSIIIIFSEIIPKSIGDTHSVSISLFVAKPLMLITRFFKPIIFLIDFLAKPFGRKNKAISEDEIRIMSQLSHMEGSIEADEKEMIQQIFKLNDLSAKDIMTPRTVVVALNGEDNLKEIESEIYSLSYSRLPIYQKDLDNIIGVCHQRDLLVALGKGDNDKKIKDFIKKDSLLFVSEDIKIDKLIPLFQKQKTHLAIVNDEFGGTAGVVTLEDVLEQIVGEIVDETDKEIDLRKKAKELNKNK